MTLTVSGDAPATDALPAVERRAVLPAGFRAGGAVAGIKASGRPDLVLIASTDGPAAAAAVFTPNAFAAAPVRRSRQNLAATSDDARGGFGFAAAVVSTSGCANAATGAAGDADQDAVGGFVSDALGIDETRVLHLSTGVIGTRLPLDRVAAGIAALAPALTADDAALAAAAEALRTTDSVTKVATTTLVLPAPDGEPVPVTVSGIAKGVGMIHPEHGHDAVGRPDRCPDRPGGPVGPAATGRGADLGPALGRRRHEHQRHGLRPRLRGAGAAPVAAGSHAAAALGRPSRRSLATSPGSRPPTARGRRRSSPRSCAAPPTTRMRGPSPGRSSAAAWSRPRPTARTRTGVASPVPPGTRVTASAAVLEAAGLVAGRGGRPGGQAASVDPDRLHIAIAGSPRVRRHGRAVPSPSTATQRARPWTAPELVIELDLGLGDGSGEAFGCDLTEQYVIEN